METFANRLRRFALGSPSEIPLTLLAWAQNILLPQVQMAKQHRMETLVFLSTHAFIQTFSEKVFSKHGPSATKYFLETFMDEHTTVRQFSLIAAELHEMRNVMAHQAFSSRTHDMAFNYRMLEGWKRDAGLLHINPDVYAEQFITTINGGRLWKWERFVTPEQLLKQKYVFIRDWLDLPKTDTIAKAITHLESLTTLQDIQGAEVTVKSLISQQYGL
jgi:hypothetical protein